MKPEFTSANIISLSLVGEKDIATCNHCGEQIEIPFNVLQTVKYEIVKRIKGRKPKTTKKSELIKTRYKFLWIFQETHLEKYLQEEEQKRKRKKEKL